MTRCVLICCLLVWIFAGCPAPREAQKEEQPTPTEKKPIVPAIEIRVASIDLSKYQKKIERDDVQQFAIRLKRDSIDILTVQGITRYPELTTRVDFVDELATRTEMRKAFGETISISGRQNGNAVFSAYPIHSSENTPYDNLHSTKPEAALQAVIDCGVRDIVLISTQLPEKASTEDQSTVVNRLASFNNFYINRPIIMTGNLPRSDALRSMAQFDVVKLIRQKDGQRSGQSRDGQVQSGDTPRIWYSMNETLRLLDAKIESTVFGPMVVAEFGVFRQAEP